MVHREEHNESYTVVDNAVVQNVNLSWEARGFFVYLLSLPDNWSFSIRGLVKQTGTSESVIRRLLDELRTYGYITMTRHIDKNGKYTKCTWDIHEAPDENNHLSNLPQVVTTTSGENHTWSEPHEEKPRGGSTTCGKSNAIQNTNNNKVLIEQSTKDNKVLKQPKEEKEERKETVLSEEEKMFLEFWEAYPRKVDKKGSFRAFKNIPKLKEVFPGIMAALEIQKQSEQWTKNNGQFIPHPTTYIHQERWLTVSQADEVQAKINEAVKQNYQGFLF